MNAPHALEQLQQQLDEEAATLALRNLRRRRASSLRADLLWGLAWACTAALCVVLAAPPLPA